MPFPDLASARLGLQTLGRAALGLLYPQDCITCGGSLDASQQPQMPALCAPCREKLPSIGPNPCPRCGDDRGPHAEGPDACMSECSRKILIFRGAVAVCRYEETAREIIHQFKFVRDVRPAEWMARCIAERLTTAPWFTELDIITPVPLHWRRRLERHFNQSELVGTTLSRLTKIPLEPKALRRIRRTDSQARLNHVQREENVKGAFLARSQIVRGATVLLLDDVMTTCATAAECARALKKAGAREVYAAVFAR